MQSALESRCAGVTMPSVREGVVLSRVQRRLFRRGLVQARRQTVGPAAAGRAAPKQPGDIACGGVDFVAPFVAFRRLVDLMTREIGADRGNVAKGSVSTF